MFTKKEFELAKEALDSSKVISFPTETVMGLGVYFDDIKAYELLNIIKNRPNDKPYTLMLGDINEIDKFAYLDKRELKVINNFMPGEMTLLLKAKNNVPGYVTHNTGVIGVRVPNLKWLCDFINYLGKPLLVPSANKSGEKPALTYKQVNEIFKKEVSFVFEEDSIGSKPSTIVDLTDKEVKILREGNITKDQILEVINGD